MIRVLQATVANDYSGLTKYICGNFKYIDREKFKFGFLTYDDTLHFQDAFESLGGVFHKICSPVRFIAYVNGLKRIQTANHYDIAHIHMSYANILPVIACKLAGIRHIIVHSHSSEIDDSRLLIRLIKKGIHKIGRQILPFLTVNAYACSELAADWMFPERLRSSAYIAKNAIDIEPYVYDAVVRDKVRRELRIDDNTFCIGHVGRFKYQKNHRFLITMFAAYLKRHPGSRLILVGDGPLYSDIKRYADQLGVTQSVLFLGNRDDVNRLLQAMDCFVLPSHFEGLPLVAIEAQASGLPCVLSDTITGEVALSDKVSFAPLTDIDAWCFKIKRDCSVPRKLGAAVVTEAGYNILTQIKEIEKRYERYVR